MDNLKFPLIFEINNKIHCITELTGQQSLLICKEIDKIKSENSIELIYKHLVSIIDIATSDQTIKEDILNWPNEIIMNLAFLLINVMFSSGFLKEEIKPKLIESFKRSLSW